MFSSCQIVPTHRLKHLYFILWIKLLNHVACHVSLRHEMGNKCSGFTNYQNNYQKRGGESNRNSWQNYYSSIMVDFLFEKDPSKGRLLQKVFGHYLWCVRCRALSLPFPEDVMSTTLSPSIRLPSLVSSPHLH